MIFVPGSKNIFFAFSTFPALTVETDVADHDRLCEKIVRPQNKGISRVGDFGPGVKILFWDFSNGKGIIEVADHDRLGKKSSDSRIRGFAGRRFLTLVKKGFCYIHLWKRFGDHDSQCQ